MSDPKAQGRGADAAQMLRVRLGDIVVELTAPRALCGYVAERFLVEHDRAVAVDVVSRFRDGEPAATGRLVGRRVSRDPEGAVWSHGAPGLPGLAVRVADGDPPVAQAWLPRSRLRAAYKRLVAGITEADRLEMLTFYTLLYPALLVAERRGRFPLHAAAVARDDRVVVIAGLPGAGKSTLSAALLSRGHSLVSDNLVLLGGGCLWPFPEPLKLDQESLALAGVFAAESVPSKAGNGLGAPGMTASYSRTAHRFVPPPGPLTVAAVVVVEPGPQTRLERVAALPSESLLDLNRLALELEAYYRYRACARLALGAPAGEAEAIEAVVSAAAGARLTVGRGDMSAAVEAIGELFGTSR